MKAALLMMLLALGVAASAQEGEQTMLFNCDSLEGVSITGGQNWPDTKLEVNTDPAFVSEGGGSLHLSGVSPADATGNSYLDLTINLPPVDLTGRAVLFDAWTSHPENSKALYLRAYNAAGECVLSFLSWDGPIGREKTSFELIRGFGGGLGWEPGMVTGQDLTKVTRLRFWVGTSGKGMPFDLYLDNIRTRPTLVRSFAEVTAAKPRYLQTTLVEGGEPRAVIVRPADNAWQDPAAQLQDAIRRATGARVPVVSEDEISDDELADTHAIILGSVVNNRRLLYLYSHGYLFADDFYPGEGGYEVRVVHDPWGTGKNVLAIGASTPAGAKLGIEELAAQMPAGPTWTLGPLCAVKLTGPAQRLYGNRFTTEPDDAWLAGQQRNAEAGLRAGVHGGLFSQAAGVGASYQLTQKEGYARAFVWLIKRAKAHRDTNPPTYGGPWGMDSDFQVYRVLPAWDVVEECPALTDGERLEVTRILFQWVTEACAPKASGTVGNNQVRHNHQTFPALGCYYTGDYLTKYYHAGEGEQWLKIADACFSAQEQAFKAQEDCNGYQWLTLYHTMLYALAKPDFTFFENDNVRRLADYAIMCMDNFGYSVTYGDTGAYYGWWSEMPFLWGAEWFYRDGRYAWALERKVERSGRWGLSEFTTRGVPVEPHDLIGVMGFPLDPRWHAFFRVSTPLEQCVDKVVFRESFDPQDQYLLLDGITIGGHKHYDGNAISRLCDNGRIWLADASYMDALPKYHATVIALRNGRSAPLPDMCALEHLRDMPQVGFSETVLRDYAGVDWHRNIIWRKGKWFVMADELQAREAGDYSFRVLWPTVGKVTLEPDGMDVEQAGQHCAIRMTPNLRFTLSEDAEYGSNWRGYEFIEDEVVCTLTGIWNGHLEAGEQVTLFTLLHASGEQVSPLRLTPVAPHGVAISGGDDPPTVVAVGGPDNLMPLRDVGTSTGHALLVEPGLLAGLDISALEYQGMTVKFPGGQDLQMALGQGDVLSWQAGRSAQPSVSFTRDHIDEVAMMRDALVRGYIEQAIAAAPRPQPPTPAGGEAPPLQQIWSLREMLDCYLLTGNKGAFEAVNAGLQMSCLPAPLPRNVFSSEDAPPTNTLDNITDGVLLQTDGGVMWDDDQTVTIELSFDHVYDLKAIVLKQWFATSSSKGKLFQLQRAVIEASDDGFRDDRRQIVDYTDTEDHGNWGAPGHGPHAYRFEDLNTHARSLRLTLTPRPGTAIYLAELEVWGNREGLELDAAAMAERGLPVHTFADLAAADIDGDGAQEIIAGSSNGKVYLIDGDGQIIWKRDTAGAVNAVCAADLEGNGRAAIIAGTDAATVEAFSAAGEPLWKYEIERYKNPGRVRDVFTARLTGDARQAVIVSADSWRYYALDAGGKLLWQYESVRMGRAGAAGDLNGDGRDDIVCGTEYWWWSAVDHTGKRLWSYTTQTGPGVNDVIIADINGDGSPEVLFGGQDGNVHALSNQGKLLWQFPTGDEITGLAATAAQGGAQTLFAASRIFNLYALSGAGEALWVTDLGCPVTDLAAVRRGTGPVLAATTENGEVFTVDPSDGHIIGRLALGGAGLVVIAADLDGDGSDEILASSRDGHLTALR